ncbi:MAG: TlpA family protein disulfide reductase [Clostridia bacterium]|nr:TlpA family protein disulfide reductase [Clostridia bacterium]
MKRFGKMTAVLLLVCALVLPSAVGEPTGVYRYYIPLSNFYAEVYVDTSWEEMLLSGSISCSIDEDEQRSQLTLSYQAEEKGIELFRLVIRNASEPYTPDGCSAPYYTIEKGEHILECYMNAEADGQPYAAVIEAFQDPSDDISFRSNEEYWDFSVTNVNGETKNAAEVFLNNRLTIVNIWGTYCPTCIEAMPGYADAERSLRGSGVGFVGIVTDVTEGQSTELAMKHIGAANVEYENWVANQALILPFLQNITYIPSTYFVDGEGKNLGFYEGYLSPEMLLQIIDELLASEE